jgi:hypothetical protein
MRPGLVGPGGRTDRPGTRLEATSASRPQEEAADRHLVPFGRPPPPSGRTGPRGPRNYLRQARRVPAPHPERIGTLPQAWGTTSLTGRAGPRSQAGNPRTKSDSNRWLPGWSQFGRAVN